MISVVLATFNEEASIERCLNSVKDFADEIIVVDGSSTDKTVDIAKKFTKKIITTTNKPNFHINKQMAIDEAKGDLILQLDADEVVDDVLKKFIESTHRQIQSKNESIQPGAWWIKRKNFFLGRFLTKGGQYPDPVIRLFIRGKAKLPQKDVHEQMVVEGDVGWADGHLIHYGNPTFADYLRKFNTYTSFSSQQLEEKRVKINTGSTIEFFIIKPMKTFFSLYLRHKGFVDGSAGFVFALMSALHYPVAYLKLWEKYESN